MRKSFLCLLFIAPLLALCQAPAARFTSDVVSGCSPIVVSFTDQSTNNPTGWRWDLGNGTISIAKNPVTTYIQAGHYEIKLIATNSNGSDTLISNSYITVFESPVVNFNASDTVGCAPIQLQFEDSSVGLSSPIISWEWAFGDGGKSYIQNPQYTYSNVGTYNVSLKVVDEKGCANVFFKPQYIKTGGAVNPDFTYTILPYCKAPVTVSFGNASTGYGNLTYKWNFDNNVFSRTDAPTHTFNQFGTHSAQLTSTNEFGCTDSVIKTMIIEPAFTDFSGPDSTCPSTISTYSVSSAPEPIFARWVISDGSRYSTKNINHTFSQPGKYTITLINDFGGCVDSITKSVVVTSGPAVSFDASAKANCKAPFTTEFTPSATDAVSWLWNFGDSDSSVLQNPSHTYLTNGTYNVSLKVTAANGCTRTITNNGFIKIKPPTARFTNVPIGGCQPFLFKPTYTVDNVDPITSYAWEFGNGGISDVANPAYTYSDTGSYDVKLSVTTAGGCVATASAIKGVNVGVKMPVDFTVSTSVICGSGDVKFTPEHISPGALYKWDFGDGTFSSATSPVHNYADTGYFKVKLEMDFGGCKSDTTKTDIIKVQVPVAKFIFTKDCVNKGRVSFKSQSISATSLTWDFGDGTTPSTLTSPVHDYATAGRYTVILIAVNGGCIDTITRVIPIWLQGISVSTNTPIICRNDTASLVISHSDPTYVVSYRWNFAGTGVGGFTTTSTPLLNHVYSRSGDFGIYVVTVDSFSCRDTLIQKPFIRVNGPVANFDVDFTSKCIESPFTFHDSTTTDGIHAITDWRWNFGEGSDQSYKGGPFTHAYNTSGLYSVSLKVTDEYGCIDTLKKADLLVVYKGTADFQSVDSLSCQNSAVRFSDRSTGPINTRLWSFGDGTFSNGINPVHNYKQNGLYTVTLKVISAGGCTDSVTKENYISIDMPKARFSLSDSIASCPPLQVSFTDSSSYVAHYTWDLADGGVTSARNPVNNYYIPGNYKVKLVVTSPGGCMDSAFANLFVSGPYGVMSYSPNEGCAPLPTNFRIKTTGAVYFTWDFGNGFSKEGKDSSASYTYTSPGKFVPKVLIRNPLGCVVPIIGSDTMFIEKLDVDFAANENKFCDTGRVLFRDSTISVGALSYRWDFGDGVISNQNTFSNPEHTYINPGVYTVKLTATSSLGCKDSVEHKGLITINKTTIPTIVSPTSLCLAPVSFSYTLDNDTLPVTKFLWQFGNGQTSSSMDPASQTFNPGTYVNRLVVTNVAGCTGTATNNLTVHPLPQLTLSLDTTICLGDLASLNVSGADKYSWDANNTLSSLTIANPTAKPLSDTWYSVTGSSSLGCDNKDSTLVKVLQPFALKTGSNSVLCIGDSVQLFAEGAQQYMWFPPEGLSEVNVATPIAKPLQSVMYSVVGYDTLGCFKDSGQIFVEISTYPTINLGPDLTLPVGSPVTLRSSVLGNVVSYRWVPLSGLDCGNCPTPVLTPSFNAVYRCIVTNDKGCSSEDTLQVFILCNGSSVFVPNTFSPNNDGANDVFYLRGKGIVKAQVVRIFNRWGQTVFERNNVTANDESDGWDGTFKSAKVETGVYHYYMEIVCNSGEILKRQGDITLLR
jgi:gliding motility-associated-like protein